MLAVSLAFGLTLLTMVYAIGPISGCHINPAVTVGLLVAGKFEGKHAPGYIIGQILGGTLAAAVLLRALGARLLFPAKKIRMSSRPVGGRLFQSNRFFC